MLMDVSEVLFNELTLFKLMQGFRGYVTNRSSPCRQNLTVSLLYLCSEFFFFFFSLSMCSCRQTLLNVSGDFEGITLPPAAPGEEDGAIGVQGAPDEVGQIGGSVFSDKLVGRPKPLDASLLQILSVSTNFSLQEEEDTLGKVRRNKLTPSSPPSSKENCV